MAMYIGINGTPKEVSSLYVGVNGQAKEAVEVYGEDSGSVKLILSEGGDPPGQSIFTSSGIMKVKAHALRTFIVGGGAPGADYITDYTCLYMSNGSGDSIPITYEKGLKYGDGGGGGYTTMKYDGSGMRYTYLNTKGYTTISVSIGASGGNSTLNISNDVKEYSFDIYSGGHWHSGGGWQFDTRRLNYGGSAGGYGECDTYLYYDYTTYPYGETRNRKWQNHSGCGGGYDGGDTSVTINVKETWTYGTTSVVPSYGTSGYYTSSYSSSGQGETTRAFGDSDGTLYSGGGGGGGASTGYAGGSGGGGTGGTDSKAPTAGGTNTGGGGGGGCKYYSGASGGTGIAIIKWAYEDDDIKEIWTWNS